MKYVKTLGLAVAMGAVLMALVADTASADLLCESNDTSKACPSEKTISGFSSDNKGVVKITTTFKTIECSLSNLAAHVAEDATGKDVQALVSVLTFEVCNCEVKVLKDGSLAISNISGSHNGTMTSNGTEITVTCSTIFGTVHCVYGTTNTHLGGVWAGSPAELEIYEAVLPRLPTSAVCSEKAKWDATYELTTPGSLFVWNT